MTAAARIDATPEALDLIDRLVVQHGPLLFHQSGGCCDGSSPMCFPLGDFLIGSSDVLLGTIDATSGGVPFHMSREQFEYWSHTHLTSTSCPDAAVGSPSRHPRVSGS